VGTTYAMPKVLSSTLIPLLTVMLTVFALACSGIEGTQSGASSDGADEVEGTDAPHVTPGATGPSGGAEVRNVPSENLITTIFSKRNNRTFEFQDVSIAIGSDGLGLISFHDRYVGDLKVAHCDDAACTSATTSTIDSDGVGLASSITIGSDGLGLISYEDITNDSLKVAHCNDAACTSATTSTIDSTGSVGRPSITIGTDGLGLISYHKWMDGDLKVAHCDDAACTSATTSTIDSDGYVGEVSSITIGVDGLGLISYFDNTNHDLKVAHCNDAACTSATTSTIDSDGSVGMFPSTATGVDGLGLISYFDNTNHDLKVAHCDNAACTSATTSTIDSDGRVGSDTSITIGADGLGLISYLDATNDSLKVAHCDNPACTSATTSTVDSNRIHGTDTSITIGTDGLALISYYGVKLNHLKVAHCGTTLCSPTSSSENVGQEDPVVPAFQPSVFLELDMAQSNFDAGTLHYCAITESAGVNCWGRGWLGDGAISRGMIEGGATQVVGLPDDVISVAAGDESTCVVTSAGGVYCWGSEDFGKLGNGIQDGCRQTQIGSRTCQTRRAYVLPIPVVGLDSGVRSVWMGSNSNHVCVITDVGGVKCWGDGKSGQYDDSSPYDSSVPVDIEELESDVVQLALGYLHSCALMRIGTVKCWGDHRPSPDSYWGEGGRVPYDTGLEDIVSIEAGGGDTCALTSSGTVICWGWTTDPTPVVGINEPVAAISVGSKYNCALTVSGLPWCWGAVNTIVDPETTYNSDPVLISGIPDSNINPIRAVDIASNPYSACLLMNDGSVVCWGWKWSSYTDESPFYEPYFISTDSYQAGHSGNTGMAEESPAPRGTLLSDYEEIQHIFGSAGLCVVTVAGGVKCGGAEEPLMGGRLSAWLTGWERYDEYPEYMRNFRMPKEFTDPAYYVLGLTSGVDEVSISSTHSCATTSSGGLWCWGMNDYGQLGDGSTDPSLLAKQIFGPNSGVTSVATAPGRTCAVVNGAVNCWGRNMATDDGTVEYQLTPTQVPELWTGFTEIALSSVQIDYYPEIDSSCALREDGTVWCWMGSRLNVDYYKLKSGLVVDDLLPSNTPYDPDTLDDLVLDTTPRKISEINDAEMSDNLEFGRALQIVASGDGYCVRTSSHIKCFNLAFEDGKTENEWGGALTWFPDGFTYDESINHEIDGSDFIDIAAGPNVVCALDDGHQVSCFTVVDNYPNIPRTLIVISEIKISDSEFIRVKDITSIRSDRGRVFCALTEHSKVMCWYGGSGSLYEKTNLMGALPAERSGGF
jgi:alpha-tubulin suppressor-like RCC1 family protein